MRAKTPPSSSPPRTAAKSQLRIIGGRWRSRRLTFPALEGVRPTPDRIRETLFNWLAPTIEGARCLDLFAGSGALGFEALSRGAASTLFIERQAAVAKALRDNLALLGCTLAQVQNLDAQTWLTQGPDQSFDMIFLDPPFRRELLDTCLTLIDRHGISKPGGLLYIEAETEKTDFALPAHWSLLKHKTAGQVQYRLYQNGP